MRSSTLLLFLSMFSFALPTVAQQPPPVGPAIDEGGRVENPPQTLRLLYKFKPGESNRYQVQMMNRGSYKLLNQKDEVPLSTVTEMFFKQTTKSEEDDGAFKVEWAMLSGAVRIAGYGESVMSVPEITYTMDDRGSVKKISGIEKLAILPGKPQQKTLAGMLVQLRYQGFPKEPLKVGDTWSSEYSVDGVDGEKIPIKQVCKLLGYEKCDGYDCAKIQTRYDYPIKLVVDDKVQGKLRLEGTESGVFTSYFAFKEGKMVRTDGDIKSDAKVAKSDGTLGDAFAKLEINAVSRLLPPSAEGKKEE